MAKDYFSAQSSLYQRFRPAYPDELYTWLLRDAPRAARVWDCATGNGQAALALARHGCTVYATDHSQAQLDAAPAASGIHYLRANAEAAPFADRSLDLVTVAQALHWFDFEPFYAEVARVVKGGGLIAAWTYSFLSVTPQLGTAIDSAIRSFYHEVIGAYWPPERHWVDEQYRTIPFPFERVHPPRFSIDVAWDLNATLGYISSWSAVQQYQRARGHDPVPLLADTLAGVWGDADQKRPLSWPLDLCIGRV